jgi:hypothetical protein
VPGSVLPSSGEVARLLFLADTNESSVLAFNASNAQAIRSNGSLLANGGAAGAPVFLVRTQALLGVTLVNRAPQFALYSPPPQTFELEFKTNLNQPAWSSLTAIVVTNQFTPVTLPPGIVAPLFVRARSTNPNGSRLMLTASSGQGWDLFINGQLGGTYTIQSRSLQGASTWRDELTVVLTNNTLRIPVFQKADSGRLYRSIQPTR